MRETPEQTQDAADSSAPRTGWFDALVEESPMIALLCMLAICLGGIFFVIRRADYSLPALELLVLILLSKKSFKELKEMAGLGGGKPEEDKPEDW